MEAPLQLTLEQYEQLNPALRITVDGKVLQYHTPNRTTAWRVQTLLTKEPDTIAWIAGFEPGCVLFDIGANVGMYTLLAAVQRDVRVFAFEPESQNYGLLNRNIYSNGLGDRVQAYPVALSDGMRLDKLYLGEFGTGGSCHNFGETVNYRGEPFQPGFSQGCLAMSLDQLVAEHGLPVPDHIKIDVDGIEDKVIAGAATTLRDPRVKSVLVEINTNLESHRRLIDFMIDLGFRLRKEQLDIAIRREGPFKGVGNHIFLRS